MGLREDLDRFEDVGEQRRLDLADFIRYGDLGASGATDIRVPIKIVELPEFRYDELDRGGIGAGDVEVGDPLDVQGPSGSAEAGSDRGEHSYYAMDPEEFARQLDEELELDLEPKGKKVIERTEGAFSDRSRAGPESMLDLEHLFVQGLKRKLAMDFDEAFMRELLKVNGIEPEEAYSWARHRGIPVPYQWLVETYREIEPDQRARYVSISALQERHPRRDLTTRLRQEGIDQVPFRPEDERYRHPVIEREYQRNVVVVNIRDVSGSMRAPKRELVERTFSPLDWYLQGKYDHAEFIYIAHDASAWEVPREEFFGITSGGGTRISSAYELAAERLDEYPFEEWNRFVFCAGDGENSAGDTREAVIPLIGEIAANRHAYVETTPHDSSARGGAGGTLDTHFADESTVVVSYVHEPDDVTRAIRQILSHQEPS